ncbi:replication protein A 70 kDa DNA-binding subunit C [Trifolium repens]|nr:replication protein A 70 kDa DNA-binding subunit C [Trifolium repens]
MFISLLHSFITKISVALARALDFIKDINDGKELWKFAVRLEDIWKTGIGKGEHLEFIILDKQGDNIHVVLPSDLCPLFESKLEEGATYIMKNFKVQPNDLKVKFCDHPFTLVGFAGLPVHLFSFFFFSKLCCFHFRSSSSVFVLCLVVIFWPLAGLAVVVPAVLFSGGCGDSRCGSNGLCGPGFAVVRFDGVVVMAGGADVVVGYWC